MAKLPKIKEIHLGALPKEWATHLFKRDEEVLAPIGEVTLKLRSDVEDILGPSGRMLSQSKSSYSQAHKGDQVWFNACIFDEEGREIWFGDLNLTLEHGKLEEVGKLVGKIMVTPENPYRFSGLKEGMKQERRGSFGRMPEEFPK